MLASSLRGPSRWARAVPKVSSAPSPLLSASTSPLSSPFQPQYPSSQPSRQVTHFYGGLEKHLRGSAGYKPSAPEIPYVDKVRAEHLLKIRMHIGHRKQRFDRHVGGLVYGFRHNIAIYDIAKTWRSLRTIFYGFAEMAQLRSSFYLLAPNPSLPLEGLIAKLRKEYPFKYNKFSSLYMTGYSDKKWMEGVFSNWKTTYTYLQHVRKIVARKNKSKKFKRIASYLSMLDDKDYMSNVIPDFMLVLATDRGALHEARNMDIPLFGMVDTNTNPQPFLYPVFGNDDSLESIQFMLELLKRAVEEGRKREHEAFATMLMQKIKQKIRPEMGTVASKSARDTIAEVMADPDMRESVYSSSSSGSGSGSAGGMMGMPTLDPRMEAALAEARQRQPVKTLPKTW